MQEYPSGDITEIARVHGQNMSSAGVCRVRHAAIVGRLKEIERRNSELGESQDGN